MEDYMTHYHQSIRIKKIIKGLNNFFDKNITKEQLQMIVDDNPIQMTLIVECRRCPSLLLPFEEEYCDKCKEEMDI